MFLCKGWCHTTFLLLRSHTVKIRESKGLLDAEHAYKWFVRGRAMKKSKQGIRLESRSTWSLWNEYLVICRVIHFLKSVSLYTHKPVNKWVIHTDIRGSRSLREDQQEWWLMGKQGTSLSDRILHRLLLLAGFLFDYVFLCSDWNDGSGASGQRQQCQCGRISSAGERCLSCWWRCRPEARAAVPY